MSFLAAVDHLVLFVPDLAAGQDRFERTLGVRPSFGGQHIGLGTHNALVSFGGSYLELIAPDPGQPAPDGPRPFGIDDLDEPRLVTFAVRPGRGRTMAELIEASIEAGHDPGEPVHMSRLRPDGQEIRWSLTFPTGRADGLIPFFIDWGDTPSPAESAPRGPSLDRLSGTTSTPETANAVLGRLGLPAFAIASNGRPPGLSAHLTNGAEL